MLKPNKEIKESCEQLVVLINDGIVDFSEMFGPSKRKKVYAAIERLAFLYPTKHDNLIEGYDFNFGYFSEYYNRNSDLELVNEVLSKIFLYKS